MAKELEDVSPGTAESVEIACEDAEEALQRAMNRLDIDRRESLEDAGEVETSLRESYKDIESVREQAAEQLEEIREGEDAR
jgi:hypothetical protein